MSDELAPPPAGTEACAYDNPDPCAYDRQNARDEPGRYEGVGVPGLGGPILGLRDRLVRLRR